MSINPDLGSTDVMDGSSPLYTSDSTPPPNQSVSASAQASGTGLDSETVQGITAVTAIVAGPNKLVATDINGKLPLSIMPTGGITPGVLQYVAGAYSALKASPPSTVALGIATDQGVAGALYFYTNNSSAGDNGWILLGGS